MSEILNLIAQELPQLQQKQDKMKLELIEMQKIIDSYQKLSQHQEQQIQRLLSLNEKLKLELSRTPQLSLSQEQLGQFQRNVQQQLSNLSLNSLIENEVKTAIEQHLQPILVKLKSLLETEPHHDKIRSIELSVSAIERQVQLLAKSIQSQIA